MYSTLLYKYLYLREITAVVSSNVHWDLIRDADMIQTFTLTQHDKIPLDFKLAKMQWDST